MAALRGLAQSTTGVCVTLSMAGGGFAGEGRGDAGTAWDDPG